MQSALLCRRATLPGSVYACLRQGRTYRYRRGCPTSRRTSCDNGTFVASLALVKVGAQCRGCPAVRRTSSIDSVHDRARDGKFVVAVIPRQRMTHLSERALKVATQAQVASGDLMANCRRSTVLPRLPGCPPNQLH